MNPHDVILAPALSEKAVMGIESGKYAFYVHPDANRTQIKDAIERVFEVEVVKINLLKVRGKIKRMGRYAGRTAERKKAIVTLQAGQRIQQLEGLT
jgi:large subunit ribosomal protein L23